MLPVFVYLVTDVSREMFMNIVDELLLKGGLKLSAAYVCLFSDRCCLKNVYTHSDHSHCFEQPLWGSSCEEGYKISLHTFIFLARRRIFFTNSKITLSVENNYLKGVK